MNTKPTMKKLPIGIQTLSHIIEGGYVYVDKTEIAHRLITSGKYYFLSRPRRFGKSLFLSTLKEIFEGNKALFKGLYIEDQWDFQEKYPVIHLDFSMGLSKNAQELERTIRYALERVEKDLGIQCERHRSSKECFGDLIWQAKEKYGKNVVILIDEYDKPILDNIINKETAREIRDEMKGFYSVIKGNDSNIQLVFLTGVSKFSKLNLFSGLNNLNDITLNPNYGNICGYTHDNLLTEFQTLLAGVDMDRLKEWYNGYNYFGERVYNPFDILLFISNSHDYRNYWWSTGNPSFLIDLIRSKNYSIPDIENFEATDAILDSFDVDNIELEPLLWQTGYLTIKEKYTHANRIKYRLEVPNLEIQHSLNDFFIDVLTTQKQEKGHYQGQLYEQLTAGNMEALKNTLVSLFAGIPYQNFTNNKIADYEGYYASVIYAYLASLGFETIPEDTTQYGSVDMTLKLDDKAYIFEFKAVEKPTGHALRQIKQRQYYQKYQSNKDCYLIGIEFGKQERNIIHYEWELLKKIAAGN